MDHVAVLALVDVELLLDFVELREMPAVRDVDHGNHSPAEFVNMTPERLGVLELIERHPMPLVLRPANGYGFRHTMTSIAGNGIPCPTSSSPPSTPNTRTPRSGCGICTRTSAIW